MVSPLTAEKLVDQVRQRVSDEGRLIFTEAKILDAADYAFQHIAETVRFAGRDHELDRLDIAPSAMTKVEQQWYEYSLPEWVGAIRRIEGTVSYGDTTPIEMLPSILETKDVGRVPFVAQQPRWIRSRFGRPGNFSIFGEAGNFTLIRVWFIRRYPPLHYGTAQGGSTTTIQFASSPTGTVVMRDSLYVGMDVMLTGGTNQDTMRRITAYTGSTRTATLDSAAPATITASQTYSLVVPLEQEHGEYFIEEVTRRLLARLANTEHLAATEPQYRELQERFKAGLETRDQSRPRTIWNRRR